MDLGERKCPYSVSVLSEKLLLNVGPLSDARTMLGDFSNSLLRFRLDTFDIKPDLHLVADDEPAAI